MGEVENINEPEGKKSNLMTAEQRDSHYERRGNGNNDNDNDNNNNKGNIILE